jgi:hypothetical protein
LAGCAFLRIKFTFYRSSGLPSKLFFFLEFIYLSRPGKNLTSKSYSLFALPSKVIFSPINVGYRTDFDGILDQANLDAENLQKIFDLIESRYLNTRGEKNLLGGEDFKSGVHGLLTADSDNLLTLAIDALCGDLEGESCPVSESHSQVFIIKYLFI